MPASRGDDDRRGQEKSQRVNIENNASAVDACDLRGGTQISERQLQQSVSVSVCVLGGGSCNKARMWLFTTKKGASWGQGRDVASRCLRLHLLLAPEKSFTSCSSLSSFRLIFFPPPSSQVEAPTAPPPPHLHPSTLPIVTGPPPSPLTFYKFPVLSHRWRSVFCQRVRLISCNSH